MDHRPAQRPRRVAPGDVRKATGCNYFRHAVCKHTLDALENFVWHRVIRWWKHLRRWNWKDVRRHLTGPNGRWRRPTVDGIELFNIASVTVTRYRYRGSKIPNPWLLPHHA